MEKTKKQLEAEIEDLKKRLYVANNDTRHAIDAQKDYLDKKAIAVKELDAAEGAIKILSVLVDSRVKTRFPEFYMTSFDITEEKPPEEYYWLSDIQERLRFRDAIKKPYMKGPY